MAKRKVNKSQKIRDYKAANPNEGPTAIAKALTAQGLKVSPRQVSTTLTNEKKKKGGVRRKKRRTKVAARSKVSVEQILQAKKLAEQMGGVVKAKAALDALSKITE